MTADDFHSATAAAACGGVTTLIPFASQHRGQDLREVASRYRARARGKAVVDYSLHLIVSVRLGLSHGRGLSEVRRKA